MRDITFLRNNLKSLLRQLYPTGRAWKNPIGSDGDKVLTVKSNALARHLYDVEEFVSTILPDNDLFNASNATNWERRLGLDYDVTTLTLEERKAEILRKLSYPGGFKNTLTLEFLEYQLRASLFDVRVYRNPSLSQPAGTELIANSVEKEEGFSVTNFNYSFIIAGDTVDTQAIIDSRRRNEFMRKILRYKPMHMVCFLLSNISKQDGSFQLKYSDYLCELIKETPPYATNVTIVGINNEDNLVVGKMLTGSYTYNDDEGDPSSGTSFQWYRADDTIGTNATPITGANGPQYRLTVDDTDKCIAFGVTPKNVKATGEHVISDYTEAISNPIIPVITNYEEGNVNRLTWTMGDGSEGAGTWEVQYRSSPFNPWTVSTAGGSPRVGVVNPNIFKKDLYFKVRRISAPTTEFSEVYSEYVRQVHDYSRDKTNPVNITDITDALGPPPGFEIAGNQYTAANIYLETKYTIPYEDAQLYFLANDLIVRPATRANLLAYPSQHPSGSLDGIKWIRFVSFDNSVWEVNQATGQLVRKYIG